MTVTTKPLISAVSVSCSPTTVGAGLTGSCEATVTGQGTYSSAVTWSINYGSITSSGVFTAPMNQTSLTITATSQAAIGISGSYTVTVDLVPVISGVTVASVTDSTATINWTSNISSLNAISYGSTPSMGLGSSGVTGTSPSITLTGLKSATTYYMLVWSKNSWTGTTVYKYLTITTKPAVTSVSVTCTPSTVGAGLTTSCLASLTGSGAYSSAVTWTTNYGTITSDGVLTVPMNQASITVTATSQQTPSVSGSFTVTVQLVPVISGITVSNVTSSSATISWTTGISSLNAISYGPTASMGLGSPGVTGSSPSITLSGLLPSTTYYMLVWSKNSWTGSMVYKVITVKTLASS